MATLKTYVFINEDDGGHEIYYALYLHEKVISTIDRELLQERLSAKKSDHTIYCEYFDSSNYDQTDIEEAFKLLFPYTIDCKYIYTRYEHLRCYGGPEEGGWYYSTFDCPEPATEEEYEGEIERGEEIFKEFIFGENTSTGRPIYS